MTTDPAPIILDAPTFLDGIILAPLPTKTDSPTSTKPVTSQWALNVDQFPTLESCPRVVDKLIITKSPTSTSQVITTFGQTTDPFPIFEPLPKRAEGWIKLINFPPFSINDWQISFLRDGFPMPQIK